MRVIVNATPLIALSSIDQLELLPELFDEVVVPLTVYREVALEGAGRPGAEAVASANWIQVRTPAASPTLEILLLGLDAGELQVLMLADELKPDWVIIDERLGRRVAGIMGIPVKGTIGVLLAAFRAGYLSKMQAKQAAQLLVNNGIHLGSRVVAWFETELEKN